MAVAVPVAPTWPHHTAQLATPTLSQGSNVNRRCLLTSRSSAVGSIYNACPVTSCDRGSVMMYFTSGLGCQKFYTDSILAKCLENTSSGCNMCTNGRCTCIVCQRLSNTQATIKHNEVTSSQWHCDCQHMTASCLVVRDGGHTLLNAGASEGLLRLHILPAGLDNTHRCTILGCMQHKTNR